MPAALAAWATAAAAVGWPPAAAWVGAALGLAGAICAAVLAPATRKGPAVLCLVALAAAAASTAAHRDAATAGLIADLVDEQAVVEVVGRVIADPVRIQSGAQPDERNFVRLAVTTVSGRGLAGESAATVVVFGNGAWGSVRQGERITATGRLSPAEPGDAAVAQLTPTRQIVVIASAGALDRAVATIRASLPRALTYLDPADAALLAGIAIGDTSALPADVAADMKDTSLTHLTAVSGGHFAIVGAAVLLATGGLGRRTRVVATAAAMTGLVLVVGPEPSVLRGAVMGAVGLFGLLARRPRTALPALGCAVVLLVVLDPWLARSLGFTLSVVATAALILVAPRIAARLADRMPRPLALAVAVPLAAQLACAPILVLVNPGLTTYAVPANLLAAPAIVPATVCGVLAAIVAPWSVPLATVVSWPAGLATVWVGWIGRWFAGLPGARLPWPGGALGAVLLIGISAGAVAVLLRTTGSAWRRLWVGTGLVLVGWLIWVLDLRLPWTPGLDPDWQVAICEVGQGSATVLRSGDHDAVVVDVGPPGGAADACLDALRVQHIDLLVLSHAHADHVGGLAPVLTGRTVDLALVSPVSDPAADAMAVTLADHEVPTRPASGGFGGAGAVTWQVLSGGESPVTAGHTGVRDDEDGPDANNASVVLLAEVAGIRVLTLGDLETEGQDRLADLVSGQDLDVDIVVAAHHGSARQSARLIRAVGAPVTVVSVGADNPYGHPTDSALALYGSVSPTVLRTDSCGTVAFRMTDGQLYVSGCQP